MNKGAKEGIVLYDEDEDVCFLQRGGGVNTVNRIAIVGDCESYSRVDF
jgi:hypothetical protein